MPVMDKLRKCAEKLGYRLDVPPDLEHVLNEAYDAFCDSLCEDDEKPETQGTDNERRRTTNRK